MTGPSTSNDVLIIGGGILGLLSARELQRAGARVTLIDKNRIGTESSWAGGGILSPLYPWRYTDPVNALAKWGQAQYPLIADALINETGIDPEWTTSGLLILDEPEPDEHNTIATWAKAFDSKLDLLVNNDIRRCEPVLNNKFTQGIHMPDVAQIRNPRLIKALEVSLLAAGVNIIENTEVTDIVVKANRVTGIKTPSGDYTADHIVVASGAWSTRLLAAINVTIDVKPVRGQMIIIDTQPGLVSKIILENNHYIIPRRDGQLLVGSTLEDVGFDKSTTEEAKQLLQQVAIELAPPLAQYKIKHHWAGLRPGSPGGIPIISAHPDIKGLFINTGHFRNGVVLGPASARLLTDLITSKRTILDPKPYTI